MFFCYNLSIQFSISITVSDLFPSLGFTPTKMGSFCTWVTTIFISGLLFLLAGNVLKIPSPFSLGVFGKGDECVNILLFIFCMGSF